MTRTEYHRIDAPSLGGSGEIAVHGHWGRPVLWFPSEGGAPWDFEANGMLDAIRPAIDDGRITVFCVPSFDGSSWSAVVMPLTDRRATTGATRLDHLAGRAVHPRSLWRAGRRGNRGPSLGAFHAVLFALRHPHVFGRAVAFSGNYDPWSWRGWGPADDETYYSCPLQFCQVTTVDTWTSCGRGSSSPSSSAVAGGRTRRGQLLDPRAGRGAGEAADPTRVLCVGPRMPHDWPSWRAQAAIYLPALG